MSAGDRTEHYVQDSAEAYLVWRLQELTESVGRSWDHRSNVLRQTFETYVSTRNIEAEFANSKYKENVDLTVERIVISLCDSFPEQAFAFQDVEKEYRDRKLKGDFVVQFDGDNADVSVSVKNYKRGFTRIQLCSGTWNSFLNNFLFESAGVGILIDPKDNSTFRGSDRPKRNAAVIRMGFAPLVEAYDYFDGVNDHVRNFYADDPAARHWVDIAGQWRADCASYGAEAAATIVHALEQVPPARVKARLLEMTGLDAAEELLLLGEGQFLFSLTHPGYHRLVESVNDPRSTVEFQAAGQSLKFMISLDGESIVSINVPFTLQKNGAWHLPKTPYDGKIRHPKEKVDLLFGERRPKKSREIATSTNTYLDLRDVLGNP